MQIKEKVTKTVKFVKEHPEIILTAVASYGLGYATRFVMTSRHIYVVKPTRDELNLIFSDAETVLQSKRLGYPTVWIKQGTPKS